jgi:L-aspartate oxidase
MSNNVHDVIIIGGGIAGLFCALKLSPRRVTVLTAAPIGQGASSAWAQGGIAAAVAEGDTPEAHARDTIAAGAGLVDEELARAMTREAPDRVRDFLAYGVPFDRTLEGRLAVGREAAHSARRIVHVRGDVAGRAIMDALGAAVRNTPSIHLLEDHVAEELVTDGPRVVGVRARLSDGRQITTLSARATVLASGGIGHLYAITTNPPQACGIGLAIAARAGAVLADTEFVQFHPTAIAAGYDPAPLASEALRGEGAILVNGAGERFMLKVHSDGDMAPRDVVARGVFAEIAAGHGAFLDARTAIGPEFPERFPTVYASCLAAGIDPVRMPIPVAPAAHYHMGGVQTDARGRTSLAGLWAAGEVASTGVHGANRLASNSLLEAVVFATRVAEDISGMTSPSTFPQRASTEPRSSPDAASLSVRDLRTTMSRHVGVIRNRDGLATALERISCIEREAKSTSLRNMATAALLVAAAAFARHESRGAHERSDYPRPDPALARRTFLTLAEARTIAAEAIHDSHRSIPAG